MSTRGPQATPEVQPWPGLLQWHSEVHRRWGRCSLHFWLLRFGEMYDREEMFDRLVEFLEDEEVGSYAAYELSGEFDILLRLWVPASEADAFADRLEKAFDPVDSREFTVREVVRHWPWRGEKTEAPLPCDVDVLATMTSAEDVATINDLSDKTHRSEAAQPSEFDVPVVERLMEANAVTDMQSTTGIRMFVRLKVKEQLDNADWLKLTRQVAEKLDQITRPKGEEHAGVDPGQFTIDEVSLYRCKDRSLLLLCRVPYVFWHSLRERLLEPIAGMHGVLQTTTLPALSRNLVRSRDRLVLDDRTLPALAEGPGSPGEDDDDQGPPVPPPPRTPPGMREYLGEEEDTEFEAKGSAFTPLENWLSRDSAAPEDANLKENSGFFRDTVGKTVAAMLNSEGGVIVIGVLEPEKFEDHKSSLLRLRVSELPRAGKFAVVGLQDPTFLKGGWDSFQLKFHRLLKEHIEGEVADLVRLSRDWHGRRTLALVQVEYPGMSDGFYLREGKERRFPIRRGGATDELFGPAVNRYIKSKMKQDRRRR